MNVRLLALLVGSVALMVLTVLAAGVTPSQTFMELVAGSVGSAGAWSGTLRETTPLLITGAAVYLALRAGLFNIGAEGQLLVGAMAAAWCGLRWEGWLGVVSGMAVGVFAGALWAAPAGLIRAYRGGHEVISTIMLNNIAFYLTTAMVAGPLKDPTQQGSTTAQLAENTHMPWLLSSPPLWISSSLLVGLCLIVALAVWLGRTVPGFEFQLVGANPRAAEYGGVRTPGVLVRAMCLSGGLAGLAGALQVLSFEGRFYEGFSSGYGFDALGVAILAGATPWGILPSALLFGVLNQGMVSVQLLGVPKGLNGIALGLLIIVFAAFRYRRRAANAG